MTCLGFLVDNGDIHGFADTWISTGSAIANKLVRFGGHVVVGFAGPLATQREFERYPDLFPQGLDENDQALIQVWRMLAENIDPLPAGYTKQQYGANSQLLLSSGKHIIKITNAEWYRVHQSQGYECAGDWVAASAAKAALRLFAGEKPDLRITKALEQAALASCTVRAPFTQMLV